MLESRSFFSVQRSRAPRPRSLTCADRSLSLVEIDLYPNETARREEVYQRKQANVLPDVAYQLIPLRVAELKISERQVMKTLTRFHWSPRFHLLVLFAGVTLLPAPASAQPALVVTPTSVSSSATVGSNAPSQTVQIRNGAKGALKWSVGAPTGGWPAWLSVAPTQGVNSGTLTVTFKTASYSNAQVLTTSFTVQASGATGSPVSVGVTANITGSAPPLMLTCPSNISATSPNGSPVVVNYTATTSGGQPPVTVTGSPASGSSFPVGTTNVTVTATSQDGQKKTCGFTVTVSTTPPTLTVTCPSNISTTSPNGGPVVVTYTATTSGGQPPVTVTGSPASGSSFPVGTTSVTVTATSQDGQKATCGFSVTVTTSSPPPSGVGPQTSITCPMTAVNIAVGVDIQSMVDSNPGGTTFCLQAGVFTIRNPITPKSGDAFIGQYGAIVDGTGWSSTETTHAAFRAYNQDIDDITIRNLIIRNMPQYGIVGFYQFSDRWTIEYNEIASNYAGIIFPAGSIIRNNYIHNNYNLGYQADSAHNSLIEGNEISYNGYEQKVMQSDNVTFRNNFIHHNEGPGIWFDASNTGALIEGNTIEDNHLMGIFYEISGSAIIRNNIVRRSGDTGIFISTSRDNQIYNNTLEDNFRNLTYLVNCTSVGGGSPKMFYDLSGNTAHDNIINVGTQSGQFASSLASANCTDSFLVPYKNGTKVSSFTNNTYDVPTTTAAYFWFWTGLKTFSDWQLQGLDGGSTIK